MVCERSSLPHIPIACLNVRSASVSQLFCENNFPLPKLKHTKANTFKLVHYFEFSGRYVSSWKWNQGWCVKCNPEAGVRCLLYC